MRHPLSSWPVHVLVLTLLLGFAGTASPAPAPERLHELKALQARQLLNESLEAQQERAERVEAAKHRTARSVRRHVRHKVRRARRKVRHAVHHARHVAQPQGTSLRPNPPSPDAPVVAPRAAAGARARALAVTPNHGASYAPNVLANDPTLDNPSKGDTQSEPTLTALGQDVLAGWNEGRAVDPASATDFLGYSYSTDGGQTFVHPNPSTPPKLITGGVWSSDPISTVNEKTGVFYFGGLYENDDLNTGENQFGVAVVSGTFAGPTFTFGPTHLAKTVHQSEGFIDKPWMAADSLSGNLYLTYTRFFGGTDSIIFIRSTDGGATWGPQLTMNAGSPYALVQGSRPVVGPDGEVYVVWKQIGLSDPNGQDTLLIRKSTDFGASFGPAVQATRLYDNFGTGAPGFNREQGITLPSIAVDRSSGPRRGRVYVAWNEAVDFWDSVPLSTQGEPVLPEVENNDSTLTAQSFEPGVAIQGHFTPGSAGSNRPVDFDYYKFAAVQGQTYVFFCDSINVRYTMRIIAPDAVSRLAFSGDRVNAQPAPGLIVWTCPRTDTYYLRLVNYIDGELGGFYQVRTGFDEAGGPFQRARDHRDAFVTSSADGITWGVPVRVNDDDPWYDDWLPEVAAGPDGSVYAEWYDFRDSPLATAGAESQTYVARSFDGGGTWQQLGPVSEAFTPWSFVNADLIPNQGDYLSLNASPTGVFATWTDGRLGTSDIWTALVPLSSLIVTVQSVAVDTSHVTIQWQASGPNSAGAAAHVYRAVNGGSYQLFATTAFDNGGTLSITDSTIAKGTLYRYAVGVNPGAGELIEGERTVVIPGAAVPLLALAITTNPARGSVVVSFSMPGTTPGTIALYDMTGRERQKLSVGAGVTPHLTLGRNIGLEAGVYLVRLAQGGHDTVKRVTFLP